jgi:predicted  nucleic acid-binding Zn-ribbon protein
MPRGGTPETMSSQRNYMRTASDLKARLGLSQEQEEKLRGILDKFFKDQQGVFEKYKEERQDSLVLKNALAETENSFEKNLSNMLTKEQMEKYLKDKDSGAIRLSLQGRH